MALRPTWYTSRSFCFSIKITYLASLTRCYRIESSALQSQHNTYSIRGQALTRRALRSKLVAFVSRKSDAVACRFLTQLTVKMCDVRLLRVRIDGVNPYLSHNKQHHCVLCICKTVDCRNTTRNTVMQTSHFPSVATIHCAVFSMSLFYSIQIE